jgi:hypothetical protein
VGKVKNIRIISEGRGREGEQPDPCLSTRLSVLRVDALYLDSLIN